VPVAIFIVPLSADDPAIVPVPPTLSFLHPWGPVQTFSFVALGKNGAAYRYGGCHFMSHAQQHDATYHAAVHEEWLGFCPRSPVVMTGDPHSLHHIPQGAVPIPVPSIIPEMIAPFWRTAGVVADTNTGVNRTGYGRAGVHRTP